MYTLVQSTVHSCIVARKKCLCMNGPQTQTKFIVLISLAVLKIPSCEIGYLTSVGEAKDRWVAQIPSLVAVVQVRLRVLTPSVTVQFSASWCTLALSQEDLSARAQRSCIVHRKLWLL